MSRVDEALRRAAELSEATAASGARVADTNRNDEIVALAEEPFPMDVADRTESDAVSAVTTIANATPTEHVLDVHRTEDGPAPVPGRSLFERIDSRLAQKVIIDREMEPGSREQYRRLAAVLHDAQGTHGVRVVMLASALSGEGKTLTAANLALTLSESYHRRVLLIDADLRKPALHNVFNVPSTDGLTEGLEPNGAGRLIVRQVSPRLSLLAAGRPSSDPMASLTSERMRLLIQEAKATFDWVLIDTPPLVLLTDANLLASMVDAALLVVRANSTPHHLVKRAVDAISPKKILGVVLNQARTKEIGYGGYYHEYYGGYGEGAKRS